MSHPSATWTMATSAGQRLWQRYRQQLLARTLKPDKAQERAVEALANLQDRLATFQADTATHKSAVQHYERRLEKRVRQLQEDERAQQDALRRRMASHTSRGSSWWTRFVPGLVDEDVRTSQRALEAMERETDAQAEQRRRAMASAELGTPPKKPTKPKGMYLHGTVGCGKTMLMDLFYECVPDTMPKRRVHYNEAMLELHALLHRHETAPRKKRSAEEEMVLRSKAARSALMATRRRSRATSGKEIQPLWHAENAEYLQKAARDFFDRKFDEEADAGVLCFDEMQIMDPFGLFALKGLFEYAVHQGCIIVATSNRPPVRADDPELLDDLYLHLTHQLYCSMEPHAIESSVDYRAEHYKNVPEASAPTQTYFDSTDPKERRAFQQLCMERFGNECTSLEVSTVFGRKLHVPVASGGAAKFDFEELCGRPLGPADYVALCRAFHTLYVCDVPRLGFHNHDRARRFITLVDEAYNHRCKVICSASVRPPDIFSGFGDLSPRLEMEDLQFETAAEDNRSRMDVNVSTTVSPVLSRQAPSAVQHAHLNGEEEQFSFGRAVSRLYEMQSSRYLAMHASVHARGG